MISQGPKFYGLQGTQRAGAERAGPKSSHERGGKRPNRVFPASVGEIRRGGGGEVLRLLKKRLKKVDDVRKSYLGNHEFKKLFLKKTFL